MRVGCGEYMSPAPVFGGNLQVISDENIPEIRLQ